MMALYLRNCSFVIIIVVFLSYFSFLVVADDGGNAGVGVTNVPPNYADIKIVQQADTIRAYLTISDYNSWMDIYKVQVNLEENGVVLHSFLYQQYEDPDTFSQLNTFTDNSDSSLLIIEACDVTHSPNRITIRDRCQLHIRFVFRTTYFSQIRVISTDRAGDSTEAFIEYAGSDIIRDSNILLIPWIGGTIKIELPPYILDIFIVLIATIITILVGRKTQFAAALNQVFYASK